jgi:hypothetical protein
MRFLPFCARIKKQILKINRNMEQANWGMAIQSGLAESELLAVVVAEC